MQIPWLSPESKIRQFPWLKIAIISFVLLISTQVYRFENYIPIKYWVFLASAVFLGVLALRNMTAALTLVMLTSATTGIVFGTGRSTPVPAGMLMVAFLCGVWLLKMMIIDRRFYLRPSPLNVPILVFLVLILISWIGGFAIWDWRVPQPGDKLVVQIGQYAIYLLSFAVMFLTAHQTLREKDLKLWTIIIIVIGFVEIFLEFFLRVNAGRDLGIIGVLLVVPVILAAAQLLFNPDLRTWQKGILVLLGLVWLSWAYRYQVFKGGWLPALIGLVILAPFRSWKLFAVGTVVVFVVVLLNWGTLVDVFYRPEVESTSTLRPLVWWDVVRMVWPRSPILGLGLANYMFYWSDPTFVPISRIAAGWTTWNAWGYAIPSHNMFVDVFAQAGILGTVIFLWAMGAAGYVVYRVQRSITKPGFMKAHVIGVFASFIAMLISSFLFADWLIPFVYNITITGFRQSLYMWILLGSVLGMYYRLNEQVKGTQTS